MHVRVHTHENGAKCSYIHACMHTSELSERGKFLVEAYCLKVISEQKAKRGKRLEKNWSSVKFRIANRSLIGKA